MNKLKEMPRARETKELDGLPPDIFIKEIDPTDSIAEDLHKMTSDERAELIIIMYQDIKYYKAGLRFLRERIQGKP